MEMKISERGNYYMKSRNLILVFKQKDMGYVVVAIDPDDERMIGYVYVSLGDLVKLADYVAKQYGMRVQVVRHR